MASSIVGSRENLSEVIPQIAEALRQLEESGMVAEVFAVAMIYLQEHPEVSIYEAIKIGLKDWDL